MASFLYFIYAFKKLWNVLKHLLKLGMHKKIINLIEILYQELILGMRCKLHSLTLILGYLLLLYYVLGVATDIETLKYNYELCAYNILNNLGTMSSYCFHGLKNINLSVLNNLFYTCICCTIYTCS